MAIGVEERKAFDAIHRRQVRNIPVGWRRLDPIQRGNAVDRT